MIIFSIISLFCLLLLSVSIIFIPYDLCFRSERMNPLIACGLSGGIGVMFVTFAGIVMHIISLPVWLLWVCLLGYIAYIKRVPIVYFPIRSHLLTLIVILIGVIAQNVVMFRGGWKSERGYLYPSLHDTMWNISIAKETMHRFPPQHPGMSGETLKNNHYLYPLFIGEISQLTGYQVEELYFRYGPILVSFLFGLSMYALSSIYSEDERFRALGVFLGYFSGNISYILPLFLTRTIVWGGNTFSSDQPFDQIINPYAVLGFAWYLFGAYCVYEYIDKKKHPVLWTVLAGAFLGSLYGYKAFGGVIAIISMGAFTVYVWSTKRRLFSVFPGMATLILFAPIFFFLTDTSSSSMKFAPGWLLHSMMTSTDKLNMPSIIDIQNYYWSIHNYLGLFKIYTYELMIYLVGNLGVRIVGAVMLLFSIMRRKIQISFFLAVSAFTSFSIPLLFNLGANAHNIVQFTPYALVIMGVLTASGIEHTCRAWCSYNKYLCVGIVILTIMAAIPVNVKNVLSKFEPPQDVVSYNEMHAFEYIASHGTHDDVILLNPDEFLEENRVRSAIYVSGLTGKTVYLADPTFAVQTGKDPTSRFHEISLFFSPHTTVNDQFLKDRNITFVLVHTIAVPNVSAFAATRNLRVQYENTDIAVLRPI